MKINFNKASELISFKDAGYYVYKDINIYFSLIQVLENFMTWVAMLIMTYLV